MERLTVTTIENLKTGDRFTKLKDKKKEVWQKVDADVKKTYYQTYRHFAKKDTDRFDTAFKKDTEVVFLRHGNE